ncbi:uncharacterized protein [Montipora capricornis]|uniref:uncharacterized protein n=1 Tax=Montipora capricornis TaxID=246305 RepID=UPI0035F1545F
MMFETIVWSKKTYSLKEFINSDRFLLPQLVQVESGIYSENEAKTLSRGQNLFIHFTKRTDKVLAKVTGKKEFFIPINFPCKVFILPTVCEDVYYSVRDIAHTTTVKFFRVVHNSPPTFRLKAGDIMEIKRTFEENRGQYIECEFVNKTGVSVKLPLDYKAAFEPLATGKQYDFAEVLHCFRFPIRVKFIPGENILNAAVNDDIEWPPVGSFLLKEKIEESAVICTSRADGNVTVLLIPTDLDVTVRPALGALTGDKDYARFCKNIHDGVDLQKRIDLSSLNASKLCIESGEAEFTVEVLYDYEEMKPPIPAKNPSGRQSECCYDECYDIPVDPWPLQKPEKLKSPPKKTAKPTVLAPKPVPYSRESRKTGMKLCTESDAELDVLYDHYEKMEFPILPRNPSGPQSESSYDDVRVVAQSLCPRKPEMLKSPPIKATKPAVLAPKPVPYSRESRKTGMKLCTESDAELDALHDHCEKMEFPILPRNPSGPQSESSYDDVRVVAQSLCPRKPEMLKSPPIKATKPAVLAPKPVPYSRESRKTGMKLCTESDAELNVPHDNYEKMEFPILPRNPSGPQSESSYDDVRVVAQSLCPRKPEMLKSPPIKATKPAVLAPKPVPYSRESRKTGMKLCTESDAELDALHDHCEKMEFPILPRNPSGPQSESSYDDVRVVAPSLCPRKPEMLKSPPIKATKSAVLAPKPRPAHYRDGHFQGAMDSTRGLTAGNCLDNEVPPPVPIRTVSRPQHNILPETTGRGDPKLYHNVLPISCGKEHPSIQTAQTEPRKTAMTITNKKVDQDIHERSSDDDFDDDDNQPLLNVEQKTRPEKIIK